MNVYAGVFLLALATLALEITLSRLLSVTAWYHLAFFAISTAMLGITAGSLLVYLRLGRRASALVPRFCVGFAFATPVTLALICVLPMQLAPNASAAFALMLTTTACALPFFFTGLAITTVMTQSRRAVGLLYGTDLLGASVGCLAVLGMLAVLDAPSLVLLCGALGAAAAVSFAWSDLRMRGRFASLVAVALYVVIAFLNSATSIGLQPLVAKGWIEQPQARLLQRWNSFSRIVVNREAVAEPQYWGPSPRAPAGIELPQYPMNIDGEAGTTLRRFESLADLEHLRYDVVNAAYFLRPRGGAAIIGVGAGRDVQSAVLFGQERVLGIELNPILVELLTDRFRRFAGLADHPAVELVVEEARSYLARIDERFSIVQMSLIDTWAATGAGAFSLSENALYTVEAWQVFLDRLDDGGIFTVSRWYSPEHLGETGRLLSLAMASLFRFGVSTPADHLAMLTSGSIATLLLSRQPFTAPDRATIERLASDMEFGVAVSPSGIANDPTLERILSSRSLAELEANVAGLPFNYTAPTDENPYFFSMLRPRHADLAFATAPGVIRGNLVATLTLLALIACLAVLTAVTIFLPLLLAGRSFAGLVVPGSPRWSGACYFSLLGAAFMLVEIGLVQRLSVFLGHPVYSLGILLFSMIASTGCGSLLSTRLSLRRPRRLAFLPAAAAALILLLPPILSWLIPSLMATSIWARALASIVVTLPVGLLLGTLFPTGMRLSREAEEETPWYWALNGAFGVLSSALAVLISIFSGISTNFQLAALLYGASALLLPTLAEPVSVVGCEPRDDLPFHAPRGGATRRGFRR